MARRASRRSSRWAQAARRYRPGQGGRFKALAEDIKSRGYNEESARRIAAVIGRRKYGSRQMAKWAAQGRRRARRRVS